VEAKLKVAENTLEINHLETIAAVVVTYNRKKAFDGMPGRTFWNTLDR